MCERWQCTVGSVRNRQVSVDRWIVINEQQAVNGIHGIVVDAAGDKTAQEFKSSKNELP